MSDGVVTRPKPRQNRPEDADLVHEGVLFNVWQWQHSISTGEELVFEQLSRRDTVLLLPVTDNGTVIFADEQQPGMARMVRTLGGRVEPGEDAVSAAERELREEAGLIAESLEIWEAWQPLTKIDWAVYLFVARGLQKLGHQTLDAGESISLTEFPIKMLFSAEFLNIVDDDELVGRLGRAAMDPARKMRLFDLFAGKSH